MDLGVDVATNECKAEPKWKEVCAPYEKDNLLVSAVDAGTTCVPASTPGE